MVQTRELTMAAKTAKAIREELKIKFPGTTFKVHSDNFSMGNSVDVYWTDGPTTKAVDEVIRKYQYGHFNGMIDMYEDTNVREDIPQAKFVFGKREISPENELKLRTVIAKKFGVTIEQTKEYCCDTRIDYQKKYYILECETDLTTPFSVEDYMKAREDEYNSTHPVKESA